MTATVRWLTFLAALTVGLGAGRAPGDPLQYAVQAVRSASVLGQTADGGKTPMTRTEVNQLLAAARQALAEGDWDKAEALVTRAEKSNIRYTVLHRDTPKKVRRDLHKARAKAQSPPLPSTQFQPAASTATAPASNKSPSTELLDPPAPAGAAGSAESLAAEPAGAGTQPGDTPGTRVLPEWPFGRGGIGTSPDSDPPDQLEVPLAADAELGGNTPPGVALAATLLPTDARAAEEDLGQRKAQALELTRQARAALVDGNHQRADRLVQQAIALEVPDSMFDHGEDRPWLVALALRDPQRHSAGVGAAGRVRGPDFGPVLASNSQSPAAQSAAQQDPVPPVTNTPPAANTPANKPANTPAPAPPSVDRLPPPTEGSTAGAGADDKPAPSLIDQTADEQQLLTRKVSADVLGRLAEARTLLPRDPKRALQLLDETRTAVSNAGLETQARAQLLRRVDQGIRDAEQYIQDNRAQIELDARNRDVLEEIDRRRLLKVEIGQKLADLVEQFNQLRDERRFEEMEVVAKRARELAPEDPIVQQVWREARFIRRIMNNEELVERKENGVFQSLFLVEESAVPPEDGAPFKHPDVKVWEQLSKSRARSRPDGGVERSERELEIERKLQSPVLLDFTNTPLSEVINHLMRLTSVNIHLDDRGLADEGITSDVPVTIKLSGEISLKSALNLILEPLHLTYLIKDEVLKITSEHLRDGETYTRTYIVADLVIPIPNFVPGAHFGLQGAINDAHAALGHGLWAGGGSAPPMALVASQDGSGGRAMINPQLLAQVPAASGSLGGGMVSGGMPFAAGPGGLGGGAQADFDSLIELITTTIEPESWEESGGPGSVAPFETNLSLVVSQTQDVHEQIVDLLEQLRRLQDLQVTIEVRFIRLNDNFFERIGVDFDFNLVKGYTIDPDNRPVHPSATVGLVAGDPPTFTADLDIPFTQGSFLATTPQFGGFDPNSAANFGFAILSDIEAFFLIQATQGDSRSNVLNAPKVTLFNGQQAFVSDVAQSPFVISVIPVVGDFAAAQQPVIVVLSEGTSLSVQAVVSPDRRYVRLTLVPLFSQIGDVDEFTFEGSSSSTRNTSSAVDEDDDTVVSESDDRSDIRQGTTVQLPTFAFVTVTTTVSVPDGGTVLLGGIKRLAEARNEVGVPLLSKVPYVDRLFRNVSIGRETQSLMMMVTPRIIIQEEEEERLLGVSSE